MIFLSKVNGRTVCPNLDVDHHDIGYYDIICKECAEWHFALQKANLIQPTNRLPPGYAWEHERTDYLLTMFDQCQKRLLFLDLL